MEKEVKLLLILCCFLIGCQGLKKEPLVNKKFIYENATLDEFFKDPDSLRVTKISFLAPTPRNSWETFFEVPPEKIEEGLEILTTAKRGFNSGWLHRLVIETYNNQTGEEKKYIFKFDCTDDLSFGDHWESEPFRQFLRNCRFDD